MKLENTQILACKVGRIVKIDYFDKLDSRNHSIEDDEIVHPDLREALMSFKDDMSEAYYSVSLSLSEHFTPNEFAVTESDGTFFLTIKGKFETTHDEEVNVSSGKIIMAEDPTDELVVKLNTLRSELFEYFWNDKNAQGKLPFDGEKKEEDNTILEKE
jgi:hypothetical protein